MNRSAIVSVLFSVPVLSIMGALIHPNPTETGLVTVGVLNAVWLIVSLIAVRDLYRGSSEVAQDDGRTAQPDASSRRAA